VARNTAAANGALLLPVSNGIENNGLVAGLNLQPSRYEPDLQKRRSVFLSPTKPTKIYFNCQLHNLKYGGESGIRTHGTVSPRRDSTALPRANAPKDAGIAAEIEHSRECGPLSLEP
jgi:hypothetical protein